MEQGSIWLSELSSSSRQLILVGIDICSFLIAFYSGLSLRFDNPFPFAYLQHYARGILIIIILKLCFFYLAGLYRPLLRHSGIELLEITLKTTFLSDGILLLFSILFRSNILPRSVQIISALTSILLILGSRLILRRWIIRMKRFQLISQTQLRSTPGGSITNRYAAYRQVSPRCVRRVVIYGAGTAGHEISTTLLQDPDYEIIAFVDENPGLRGREINRIPISHVAQLGELINQRSVTTVLLAIPSASSKTRQRIFQELRRFNVEVKTIPTVQEILSGKVKIDQIRNLDIADLLGREEVQPDARLMQANITHRTVLVTGAGGSIGSELCRQIAQQYPCQLILYEINEFALYSIDMELAESHPQLNRIACLGSVTDAQRFREVLQQYNVETVFHAAAYKHVPLVETNPAQGILNNTYGTLIASRTANECGVDTFVLISTDKAVRPTNVMGASKRAAELILQAFAAQPGPKTRFVMVRFGNVLGSSGSVVPLFRKQIANGQPITLTHPNITRYFMSIPEAARLVIQAGAMGNGGEVFLLDMGEPVRIYDLAVQMIELSGLVPGEDIDIQITGLRPGEKLYEELLISGDNVEQTQHRQIYCAREKMIRWTDLEPNLNQLFLAARQDDRSAIRAILPQIVAEYQPKVLTH